jgi:hypothetical protein
MYRWFEVRNRRTSCRAKLTVTLSVPSGTFAYAPGITTSFTQPAPSPLQAYTSRRVYVSFAAPATGGPDFTGTPSVTLTLSARAVDPPPVDTVLVFDRSGSMSEPTGVPGANKMDLAIQAANPYVSLLKDNDRIGAVRFNDNAANPSDILQTLIVAGDVVSGAGRAAVRAATTPANLTPTGATSIGGGTIPGSSVLDAAVATARAVVVLTDGIQNSTPDIATARATVSAKTPNQRVFAAGLGLNQLEDSLVQLASVTNGTARITGDLGGDREFLLQKLYVQILSDVGDEAFVEDRVGVINPGTERATDVWIGEVDVAADLIVAYRQGVFPRCRRGSKRPKEASSVRAMPARPSRTSSLSTATGTSTSGFSSPSSQASRMPKSASGRIWLASRKGRAPMQYTHVSGAESANVPFIYSAIVKARSDLLLRGFIAQNTYGPGSPMNVVLEPALYGQPVMFEDTVEVTAERPNGVTRVVPLNQNACGQYEGTLTDTRLVGPYRFTARVDATTPHGNQITRYRSLTAGRVVAFVRDVFAQPLGGPPRPFASLRLPAMVSPQPGRAALR